MSLLVLGSAAYDTIETPFDRRERVLGGSGVYSAMAASLFTNVRLVGVVGDDWRASDLEILKEKQIDLAGLEIRSGAKTLYWSGKYFNNMNDRETKEIQLNVMGEAWDPLVPQAYRKSDYVFLANGGPASHLALLDKMEKKPKLVIADTMDFYINNTKDDLLRLMKRIDGLILNDSEAKLLTGAPNCITAGKEILKLGPKFVVIKKGEHGAIYISSSELYIVPAYPTEKIIDPTGAGDTFAGALMGYLAHIGFEMPVSTESQTNCCPEMSNTSASSACEVSTENGSKMEKIKEALAFAAVVASFCVEGFSLEQVQKTTWEQIRERFNALRKMAAF